MPQSMSKQIPVTVLTGYLGSGKTTLVNHILTDKTHGKKIAIIENEFGEVGIDDALMAKNAKEQIEEEIVEMMNGCICCTVRQDLVVVLKKFKERILTGNLKLDAIIIETTGMADPAPVAQTFFVEPEVEETFLLDGIVTMVDAKHIEQHLDSERPEGVENESIEQVAFADRIILNKTDLVSEDDLVRVEKRLKSLNPQCPIMRTTKSEVSPNLVLDLRAFDLERTIEMDPEFLNTENEHLHDTTVSSLSVVEERPVDINALQRWIQCILMEKGQDIYRMKGVLNVDNMPSKFMFQAVHMIFKGGFDQPWAEGEERISKFVFIGKNLDHEELREGFLTCVETAEKRRNLDPSDLRFAVGDSVKCRTGEGWLKGKVVQHFYSEPEWPKGLTVPYQIKLNNGAFIYAPEDNDTFIRPAKQQ